MSQSHTVALIGSQFRIEPWTKILPDGGFTITLPHEVQNVAAAVHQATWPSSQSGSPSSG